MRAGGGGRRLLLGSLLVLALGVACRQTIVLEEPGGMDGGNGGSGTRDGGGGGGTGGTGRCDSLTAVPRLPEVMILLDHSNTMNPSFGDSPSRLAAMQAEIQKIVQSYQNLIWFGYQEFPTSNPDTCGNQFGCCAGPITPPGFGIDAIDRALFPPCTSGMGCAYAFDQRPMADALAQISRIFTSSNANGHHRYILLVTGGEANCDGASGNSACFDAMNQANNLRLNSAVKTIVLVIGNDFSSSDCLDGIATAGGEQNGQRSPFFYQAGTQPDLDGKIGNILRDNQPGVVLDACQIIDLSAPAGDPSKVQVLLGDNFGNSTVIPHDQFNGWDFRGGSNTQITLLGDYCRTFVMTQNAQLQVLSGPGCSRTH